MVRVVDEGMRAELSEVEELWSGRRSLGGLGL